MILEPPAPKEGECSLLKTTKLMLQIGRGSPLPGCRRTRSAAALQSAQQPERHIFTPLYHRVVNLASPERNKLLPCVIWSTGNIRKT